MATTLEAPPDQVWPWLVQMGWTRAGWYSWDVLDNFAVPSAQRIHPEWQDVRVGDVLTGMGVPCFEVAALEPPHFLALRSSFDLRSGKHYDPKGRRPRFYTDGIWAFELKPLPNARTRLIVRTYGSAEPQWLQDIADAVFWQPAHWIMQLRQFQNLKRLTRALSMRNVKDAGRSAY